MLGAGLLLAAAIGALVSAIGWLTGWNAARQFSDGLFVAGALVMILGAMAIVGGFTLRADFGVIYSQSAGDMSLFERTKQTVAEMVKGYRAVALGVIVGGWLILLSILVDQLFGS